MHHSPMLNWALERNGYTATPNNGTNDTRSSTSSCPQQPTGQIDLRNLSQLVRLCNITVASIDSNLQLENLVKAVEMEAIYDLRNLQSAKQFRHIVEILDDVVEAREETGRRLNEIFLPEDCCMIHLYKTLMNGVDSIPQIVYLAKAHAHPAYTANKAGKWLPGRDVVGLIRNTYVEL